MKVMKGVVFAFAFLIFFTLMFSAATFLFNQVKDRELDITRYGAVDKLGYVPDDVASSLRSFLEFSLSVTKNQSFSSITVSNTMSSSLNNASSALDGYRNFVEGKYSNQTNAKISLDTSRLAAPFIFFDGYGLNYSWNSLVRNVMLAFGNANVTGYLVRGLFSSNCKGAPWCATGGVSWHWVACGAGTVYVVLDVSDPRGMRVRVGSETQGCVSTASTQSFRVNTVDGGVWTMYVGSVSGLSPAISFEVTPPLHYYSTLTINVSQSVPTTAWLPVAVTVDNVTIPNLIILEK
jgi:hypothetical protein